jgi:hypothetical protein
VVSQCAEVHDLGVGVPRGGLRVDPKPPAAAAAFLPGASRGGNGSDDWRQVSGCPIVLFKVVVFRYEKPPPPK